MTAPQATPRNSRAGVDGVGGAQMGEDGHRGQARWMDKEAVVHTHNGIVLS